MKNRIRSEFTNRKSDRELAANIRRRLNQKGHRHLSRIRCNVDQGSVILSGFTANNADRQLAVRITRDCPKVHGVVNRIQLHPVETAVAS